MKKLIVLFIFLLVMASCSKKDSVLEPKGPKIEEPIIDTGILGEPDEIFETPGHFSQMKHKYLDRAIAYEYSKSETQLSLSLNSQAKSLDKTLQEKTLEDKYKMFMEAREFEGGLFSKKRNMEDENFYSQLNDDMMEEVDGYVKISDTEIDETTEDENEKTDFYQNAGGRSYSKFEILEMAEDEVYNNKARAVKLQITAKWGSKIPYRFESSVDEATRKTVREVMDELEGITYNKIKFEEIANTAANATLWNWGLNYHIKIFYDNPGISTIGRGPWASAGIWNDKATIRHEFGHILGFLHEHQKYNRDDYLKIDVLAVDATKWGDYIKIPKSVPLYKYIKIKIFKWTITLKIGFTLGVSDVWGDTIDYKSIMMYQSKEGYNGRYNVLRKDGVNKGIIEENTNYSELYENALRSLYRRAYL